MTDGMQYGSARIWLWIAGGIVIGVIGAAAGAGWVLGQINPFGG